MTHTGVAREGLGQSEIRVSGKEQKGGIRSERERTGREGLPFGAVGDT